MDGLDQPRSYASMAFEADCNAALDGGRGFGARAVLRSSGLSRGEYDRLLAAGIDREMIGNLNVAGDLGTARVDISRDGARFAPGGPDGRLLLGVRDADFALVDVAALASHDEDQWSLLTGFGEMLGAWHLAALDRAVAMDKRAVLFLHATPWDWLRAGGDGVCVLNWTPAVLGELRSLGERVTLMVNNFAERATLRARLEHGGMPMVSIPVSTDANASLAERFARRVANG